MEYLHSMDVVHRDLKAENLVFIAKGSPGIKFIDFGGASTCGGAAVREKTPGPATSTRARTVSTPLL